MLCFFYGEYVGMGWLDLRVDVCLTFKKLQNIFKVVLPFPSATSLLILGKSVSVLVAILTGMWPSLIVLLICISVMGDGLECSCHVPFCCVSLWNIQIFCDFLKS